MVIKTSATIAAFLIVLVACHVVHAYTVNFAPKSHCGFGPMCPPPICMPASCAPMTCPPPQMGPRPIIFQAGIVPNTVINMIEAFSTVYQKVPNVVLVLIMVWNVMAQEILNPTPVMN